LIKNPHTEALLES